MVILTRPTRDTDEEDFEPYEHALRDLTSIFNPIGPAVQYLRHRANQCLQVHLSRWNYHIQSLWR